MQEVGVAEILIEDINDKGQGVGRDINGLVVFVPGAVPGDVVRVRILKIKKNYAVSELLDVIKASDKRSSEFDCPYLRRCGGCSLALLRYDEQLKLKKKNIEAKLQRIAGLDEFVMNSIKGMEEKDNGGNGPYRYRNKAVFQVAGKKVGVHPRGSWDVIDCKDCYIQTQAAMAAAEALRQFMRKYDIEAYNPRSSTGIIRAMTVRTAFETGEVMVILDVRSDGLPCDEAELLHLEDMVSIFEAYICETGYMLQSVVIHLADGVSGEDVVIAGTPSIVETVGDLKFEISPGSFFQINTTQMRRLYDIVKKCCVSDPKPVILDLYCGIGSIGLYLSDIAEYVVGIENVKSAVLDANRNAVINNIVNARYILGKTEEILPMYLGSIDHVKAGKKIDQELAKIVRRAEIAVLDPPRGGCRKELLEAIAAAVISKVVYVSCDPATMARDVKILSNMGYELVEVTPVDMFPHTLHVETVVLMSRAGA